MDRQSIYYYMERHVQSIELDTYSIVAVLVNILNNQFETTKHIADWLQCLSQTPAGLFSVYYSNGIPVLVKLLNSPEESVSYHSIIILHNLLQIEERSKEAICEAGGLQTMMILLKRNNEKFLSIVTECLKMLVYGSEINKLIIFSYDGPAELVRIMKTCSYAFLLCSTSELLRTLSVCSSNRRAIVESGGVQTLAKHLSNPYKTFVVNCLWALLNLSDAATKEENVTLLLHRLIELLRSRDKEIIAISSGILSNMTFDNVCNKLIIYLDDGISTLVNALLEFQNAEEIAEPIICTLCHLTIGHPEAESAQNAIRLNSGLQLIVNTLNINRGWLLIKAAIGLLRNLVLCSNNHEPLRALGIVPILRHMLHYVYHTISRVRTALELYDSQPIIIDGVNTEEIIEGILKIFLDISQNVNLRVIQADHDIIYTLIQNLIKGNENVLTIVASLFSQIAYH